MNKKKSNTFLAISFSQGFVSPNIPITTITQGDLEMNFIIDTGSDRNVIDSNVLPNIKYETKEDAKDNIVLTGLGGTQEVKLCTIPFQLEGKDYTAEFLASDMSEAFGSIKKAHAIPLHGMLGSRFLKENKIVLDFTNMVAYNKE